MAHVTVPEVEPFVEYTVTTADDTFTIPSSWAFFDESTDIRVFNAGTELTYNASPSDNTEFSVSGTAGTDDGFEGGTVTLGGTVTSTTISLQRDVPTKRTEDFAYPSSTLNIQALNTALDKIAAWAQQLLLKINRTVRLADGDSAATLTLPDAATRADGAVTFDSNGDLTTTKIASLPADATMPNASTDNAFAKFDGTSGIALQNSQTTEDDNGNVTFAKDVTVGEDLIEPAYIDVASATTTDLGAAAGRHVRITGTTTITGLGTVAAGIVRKVRFAAALTLTHNGTSLILPGSANITTAADDTAEFISLGSGNWLCVNYKKADGTAVVDSSGAVVQSVEARSTSTGSTASTSFIDTGISVTITPTSASNEVEVTVSATVGIDNTGLGALTLFRDSTELTPGSTDGMGFWGSLGGSAATISDNVWTVAFTFRDAPPTTSATVYKLYIKDASQPTGRTVYYNRSADGNRTGPTTMVASEIS